MEPTLATEQSVLQDSARKFFEQELDLGVVRKLWRDDSPYPSDLWTKISRLGWLGLRVPEAYGGLGLRLSEIAPLFEESGRALLGGPFLSTVLVSQLINDVGSQPQKQKYLPRIVSGEMRGACAVLEPEFRYDAAGIQLAAKRCGGGFSLNGCKLFVLEAHSASLTVVAARTDTDGAPEGGITLFLVEKPASGLKERVLRTLDGRKQCELTLDDVRVPESAVLGTIGEGWLPIRRSVDLGAAALALEMVGGAQKVLEMALEYARTRVAFGRPIGTFQAIQHKCAEMLMEIEGSRSIAYHAADVFDDGGAEAEIAASAAKIYCGEMFRKATAEATQIFGAIALTWEHDLHFFMKRAKANEFLFGDAAFHRERIARLLGY